MKNKVTSGAAMGALWISHRLICWADEGRSTVEIINLVSDLTMVLVDWHEAKVEMPVGEPWRWCHSDLDHFITLRKSEWL